MTTWLNTQAEKGQNSPESAASLSLSRSDVGADFLDVSPLLLQDMATGDVDPLLQIVEVDLCVCVCVCVCGGGGG